jgi:hypothetical protein
MARDVAGEINKMIAKRDMRKIAVVNFSEKAGTGGSGGGVIVSGAKIYRQTFSAVSTVIVTHNFGDIPLVFVLAEGFPFGMGAFGAGAYGSGNYYYRLDEAYYTVAYGTTACIVNFTTPQTGQAICLG